MKRQARTVVKYVYMFTVFNVFLVFAVSGSVFSSLSAWISSPASSSLRWLSLYSRTRNVLYGVALLTGAWQSRVFDRSFRILYRNFVRLPPSPVGLAVNLALRVALLFSVKYGFARSKAYTLHADVWPHRHTSFWSC